MRVPWPNLGTYVVMFRLGVQIVWLFYTYKVLPVWLFHLLFQSILTYGGL